QVGAFFFDSIGVAYSQLIERGPLLPLPVNELPLVLTNRATRWWLLRSSKLGAAGDADKITHSFASLRCSNGPAGRSSQRLAFLTSPAAHRTGICLGSLPLKIAQPRACGAGKPNLIRIIKSRSGTKEARANKRGSAV